MIVRKLLNSAGYFIHCAIIPVVQAESSVKNEAKPEKTEETGWDRICAMFDET